MGFVDGIEAFTFPYMRKSKFAKIANVDFANAAATKDSYCTARKPQSGCKEGENDLSDQLNIFHEQRIGLQVFKFRICCLANPSVASNETSRHPCIGIPFSHIDAELLNLYHGVTSLLIPVYMVMRRYRYSSLCLVLPRRAAPLGESKISTFLRKQLNVTLMFQDQTDRFESMIFGMSHIHGYMDNPRQQLWFPGVHDDVFESFKSFLLNRANIRNLQFVHERSVHALLEQRHRSRRILNLDAILQILKKHGVQVMFHDSRQPLAVQLQQVYSADLIIGAHGAFQTLGAFGKYSAIVYELQPYNFQEKANTYPNWAKKFRYRLITLESEPCNMSIRSERARDLIMPTQSFDYLLRRSISTQAAQ